MRVGKLVPLLLARLVTFRLRALPPRDRTREDKMRKCVLALLVASSFAIVTAAQDQAPGGGRRGPSSLALRGAAETSSSCELRARAATRRPGAGGVKGDDQWLYPERADGLCDPWWRSASCRCRAQAKFVLANAKAATGAGAVGTAGAAVTATRYQLEGEEKTISPHVNHQVEITGTVQPAGAGAAAGAAAAGPMLKVESVKMIAAKCS